MLADVWLNKVDEKCDSVVAAFAELDAHIETLSDIPSVTNLDIEEVCAVMLVKINRMHQRIADAGAPSQADTEYKVAV